MADAAPEKPTDAEVKLRAFNTVVQARFKKVAGQFEGSELDPTKSLAFKKFVNDHLAIANSWYVVTGAFLDPATSDPDRDPAADRAKKMAEQGFVVSADGKPIKLDPLMVGSAAAIHAAAEGAFEEDDESQADVLGPKGSSVPKE